jgi:leader peptidase (prepilin peptidase)/N-methyltransferase
MFLAIVFLFLLFICWGSFLNSLAYRMTYDKPLFTKRSYCPSCKKSIAWYDNIPILSWIFLRAKCRFCASPITILYPFIELLSGVIFTALFFELYHLSPVIFFVYFLFFSALIGATRTDLQELVIPQAFSLWLIPVGFLLSLAGLTYVTWLGSLLGALFGYGLLWLVGFVFKFFAKREGIGVGDMELLGMIGAFLGPIAAWISLLIASIVGLIIGTTYLYLSGKGRKAHIPFGPFIALGATIYFFFHETLLGFLF